MKINQSLSSAVGAS